MSHSLKMSLIFSEIGVVLDKDLDLDKLGRGGGVCRTPRKVISPLECFRR